MKSEARKKIERAILKTLGPKVLAECAAELDQRKADWTPGPWGIEPANATPYTDARACKIIGFFSCETVPADNCRKMERDRAALLAALRGILYGSSVDMGDYWAVDNEDIANARAAIALAEKGPQK